MGIHAKLLAAQKAVGAIAKTGTNTHFNYKFFEEREVLRVAREALNDAGLAFFYSVESVSDREVETKSGRVEFITDAFMLCTIFDGESGGSLSGKAIGRGQDGQDKGINKAIVAGLKYWLLKVLMIPTDDDTEHDHNTNTEGNRATRPAERTTPRDPYTGASEPENFDAAAFLASKAIGKKANGRTWTELLTDEDGRGYIRWAITKMERLNFEQRQALTDALAGVIAGPVDVVKLQDLLNRAATVEAVSVAEAAKLEGVIERADPDELARATAWLTTQMDRKKLGAGV